MSAPRRASRKAEARCVRYAPLRDPEFRNVFGNPKRGGFVRRELEGYGAKKVTEVGDDLRGGSCCYLRKGETEYPYDERGKRGGVRYATTPIKDCARGAGLESCESQRRSTFIVKQERLLLVRVPVLIYLHVNLKNRLRVGTDCTRELLLLLYREHQGRSLRSPAVPTAPRLRPSPWWRRPQKLKKNE